MMIVQPCVPPNKISISKPPLHRQLPVIVDVRVHFLSLDSTIIASTIQPSFHCDKQCFYWLRWLRFSCRGLGQTAAVQDKEETDRDIRCLQVMFTIRFIIRSSYYYQRLSHDHIDIDLRFHILSVPHHDYK